MKKVARLTLALTSILTATAVAVGLQTAPAPQGQTTTAAEKKETISGTVTRADTKAALAGVRLELMDSEYQRLSAGHEKPCKPDPKSEVSKDRHFVTTDAKGAFTFKDVVPGKYYLFAENEGFLKFAYGQRGSFPIPRVLHIGVEDRMDDRFSSASTPPIPPTPPGTQRGQLIPNSSRRGVPENLAPGTAVAIVDYTSPAGVKSMLQNLQIAMTPAPTIAGRVVDEKGMSLAAASVQLYQFRYTPLNGRSLKSVRAAITDDEGKYRLFWLDAARYLVAAGYSEYGQRPWTAGLTFTPNLPAADAGLPMLFYPDSPSTPNAIYLTLNPGTQPIVDFRLRPRLRLTARVQLTGNYTPSNASLVFVPSGGDLCAGTDYGVQPLRDGTFEIRDVPEGSYVAVVMSGKDFVSDLLTMKVENGRSNQLAIPVAAPATIRGNVYFESGYPETDFSGVRVNLTRKGQELRHVASAVPTPSKGQFSISGLGPGSYYPTVDLPPGFYVDNVAASKFDVIDPEKCAEDVALGTPDYTYMDLHGHLDATKPLLIPATIPSSAECLTIRVKYGITLRGFAYDRVGHIMSGALVVAVPKGMWAKTDDGGATPADRVLTTTTDTRGYFELLGATQSLYPKSISMQEYRLYAFESIDPNELFNPAFADRFQNREGFKARTDRFIDGGWKTISEASQTLATSESCDSYIPDLIREYCLLTAIPATETTDIR